MFPPKLQLDSRGQASQGPRAMVRDRAVPSPAWHCPAAPSQKSRARMGMVTWEHSPALSVPGCTQLVETQPQLPDGLAALRALASRWAGLPHLSCPSTGQQDAALPRAQEVLVLMLFCSTAAARESYPAPCSLCELQHTHSSILCRCRRDVQTLSCFWACWFWL